MGVMTHTIALTIPADLYVAQGALTRDHGTSLDDAYVIAGWQGSPSDTATVVMTGTSAILDRILAEYEVFA